MSTKQSPSKTSDRGVEFICAWEKYSPIPYTDQSGHITWGYGHAQRKGEAVPKYVSEEAALDLMKKDITVAEDAVAAQVKVHLAQHQFDALVSLCFNIGSTNLAESTLLKLLNSEKYVSAVNQFLVWNKVRNPRTGELEVSNGLLVRRSSERNLFLSANYDASH